jgi:hypothetical protein
MRIDKGERGIYDIYKYYKTTVKEPLDFKTFKKVVFMHNKLLAQEVIEFGSNVRLPNRLGYFKIRKTKMNYKNLKFDYGTYNKTGVKAFHLNEHSDDFKCRFLWNKAKCIVKGKKPWSFTPSRENKRWSSKMMQEDHRIYTEEI